MRSHIEPMKKTARTLRSHRTLILNYFRAKKRLSSGAVEGLNNKAKLTMRKSFGFRTFHVTEIALYHALGERIKGLCGAKPPQKPRWTNAVRWEAIERYGDFTRDAWCRGG